MFEWKEYHLKNLLVEKGYIRGPFGSSLKRGEMKNEGTPVYEQEHAIYNRRSFRFFIDAQKTAELKRFQVKEDDLIISCSGTVGRVSIIKKEDPKGIISQALLLLRPNTKLVFPEFLHYFFKSKEGFNQLVNASEGSVQPNISSRAIVESIPIKIPSKEIQKKILSILFSLDNKIDLLQRQNKTLEQLAETLYRQWFIEEADISWNVGKLEDLIDVKYGKDHKKLIEGNIPVYGSGGIMRYADSAIYSFESVLVPRKGTLNNIVYTDEPFWTVDTMFYTVMKRPNLAKFIFFFLKGQDLASMNVGSAVPSMTTELLNNMIINIPPDIILEKFEIETLPLYKKIKFNTNEIHTLVQLRDMLLPKLMSGEVRINN